MSIINQSTRRGATVEKPAPVSEALTELRYLLRDCQVVIMRNDPDREKLISYLYKLLPILDRNIKRLAREIAKTEGPRPSDGGE